MTATLKVRARKHKARERQVTGRQQQKSCFADLPEPDLHYICKEHALNGVKLCVNDSSTVEENETMHQKAKYHLNQG